MVEVDGNQESQDIVYKIVSEQEFIPSQINTGGKTLLNMGDNITKSGVYDVIISDNLVRKIAFNYDKL